MSFKIEFSWTESARQKVTETKYFKLERILKGSYTIFLRNKVDKKYFEESLKF